MTPYVFISYSHADLAFAVALSARLTKARIPHFRDEKSIDWGDDIPDRIHEALERSTHLVVLISPGSEKSAWVAYEMGYARGKGTVVVPYLLHPSMTLPGFIGSKRHLKTARDEKTFISKLTRSPLTKSSRAVKQEPVETARKMLRSPNGRVRRDGLQVLIDRKDTAYLMSMLGDQSSDVRAAAAEGCSRLVYFPALPYMVAGMHRLGKSTEVSIRGVEKLLKPFGAKAVDALLEDGPNERDNAGFWARALAETLDDSRVATVLKVARETPDDWLVDALISNTTKISAKDLMMICRGSLRRSYVSVWRAKSLLLNISFEYLAKPGMKDFFESLVYEVIRGIGSKSNWDADHAAQLLAAALAAGVLRKENLKEVIAGTTNQRLKDRAAELVS